MKFQNVFWGGLLLFFSFACHRRDKTPILYVDKAILPYCWFPTGSYWIYEEENTPGWIDSVYVMSTWIEIEPDETQLGYKTEYYGSTLKMRGKRFGQGRRPWAIDEQLSRSYTLVDEGYSEGLDGVGDIVLFSGTTLPGILPQMTDSVFAIHLDSAFIGGALYHDVFDVYRSDSSRTGFTNRALLVRDIGVARRVMKDGTIWNLVRYSLK